MVRKDKKIAVYSPPTESAFFGALIRAGAKFVGARHKDYIKGGLERAAAQGMFGRRRDPNRPKKDRKVRGMPPWFGRR